MPFPDFPALPPGTGEFATYPPFASSRYRRDRLNWVIRWKPGIRSSHDERKDRGYRGHCQRSGPEPDT
jgi:hypothetical protein